MLRRIIAYFKTEIKAIRNGKAFVFLVCLALATFLWLLNALEKRYTDRITLTVKYVNMPPDKHFVGKLPEKFDLTVDALGYTLLRYKLRLGFSPLLLDVNELTNHYLESRFISKYSISTNRHKEEFAKQISSEIGIINIRPDSITFKVSHVIEKLIKIRPNVDVTFAKEFVLQKPPLSKPESILVTGPEEILDTIKDLHTRPVKLVNLSQTVVRDAGVIFPPELKSDIDKVSVQIAVEQYTEAKFEIPITILNRHENLLIKTFPSRVKVSCRVGISQYNKLNNTSFQAIIDYEHRSRILSKLPVTLRILTDNVLSVDYFPKEVDYIIESN